MRRFIDLFAGIGGFRTALTNKGLECVFSSEINEACRDVYSRNYKEQPFGDIAEVDINDIPEHDILTAGFPCQPFSICGKKKGFDDERGTLFFHIKKIIDYKRPKVVILENVKYLIHHDKGNTLRVILNSLHGLGYFVEYRLLNAVNFGVPQNRERIIIMATRDKPFNFNQIKKSFNYPLLKDFLDKKGDFEYLDESEYTLINDPKKQSSGLIFVGYRNKGIWKKGVRENTEHLSRVHRQPNRIYSDLGTHPTIPSQETSGRFFVYISKENKVRKLTLNECYRIMGFSDDFLMHSSKSESYKQIGNSVCIPMVEKIIDAVLENELLEVESNELQRKIIRAIPTQQNLAFI